MRGRVIWGDISRPINGENVLGGVAYICLYRHVLTTKFKYHINFLLIAVPSKTETVKLMKKVEGKVLGSARFRILNGMTIEPISSETLNSACENPTSIISSRGKGQIIRATFTV